MSAVDTGFMVILLMLIIALAATNFAQARTNMKTQYQNYFGLMYLIAFVFLLIAGWQGVFSSKY
jgi:heme/copper-type cytochrome/quinol oxidase subunit 2